MAKKFVEWNLYQEKDANVAILGIILGKGSKEMLSSLRDASNFVDVFDVDRKVNMLENVKIVDKGDITPNKLEDITNEVKGIVGTGKFPLITVRSHLLSLFTMQAFPKDTKIISFDAHADIKDSYMYEGIAESVDAIDADVERYNCTTWLRRLCEINGAQNVAIVGLRDCDEDDFEFIENNGIFYLTPSRIRENMENAKERLREFAKNSKVYISLDVDVFDPSIAPAVEHPEPNGLYFNEFLELIDEVCKGNVVGMDLVEIKPLKDNKITEFLAVETVFQILSRIIKK